MDRNERQLISQAGEDGDAAVGGQAAVGLRASRVCYAGISSS
jgi:hypothetical protein